MLLRRFFPPAAWGRFIRRSVRQWPAMRATTAQWPRWVARQLLMPAWRLPMTITTRHGTRIRLDDDRVDDLVLLGTFTREQDLYFPALTGFDPEGVILDVGAHHGLYAVEALRRYPRCRLIAVEPDPDGCRRMAGNVRLNDLDARVRIVNAGLSAAAGRGWLERDASGSWASRVRPAAAEGTPPTGHGGNMVRLLTLAEVLEGQAPVIIKCNAEGAEFALVPQLIQLNLRPALIVLMAHPRFGSSAALVRDLEGVGYTVRDADDPPRQQRFHCVRRSHADRRG